MSSISINTNTLSLLMQSNLTKTTNALAKSLERLSTGKKLNSAADGAAELSISKKLQTQISGTIVAQDNVQHGQLLLNQADSALQGINENITKIRDLAVKAANETYSQEQRDAMALEAKACVDQINNIVKSTSFNGIKLLDGSLTDMQLQIGPNGGDVMEISSAFVDSRATSLGLSPSVITEAFSSASKANAFIATADNAMKTASSHLATVGSYSNSLESVLDNLRVKETNLSASNSLIMDVDYAKEISNYLQLQIMQETTLSLLSQANTQGYKAVSLLGV